MKKIINLTLVWAFLIGNVYAYTMLNGPHTIGDPAMPDPSAILQIEGTEGGLLLPRLTTTQRDNISSPAEGLQIYNTTLSAPQTYDGTTWTSGGGGGSGDVTGPVSSTDNEITRFNGTGGDTVQGSGVLIDDFQNITGVADLTYTGDLTTPLTANRVLITNGTSVLNASAVTDTELGYLDGVTSAVQTQLDAKIDDFTSTTDNLLLRTDGTSGDAIQDSGISVNDTDDVSGINILDVAELDIGASTQVSGVLDEDTMVSDSATSLATQQSIKAYVDANAGGSGDIAGPLSSTDNAVMRWDGAGGDSAINSGVIIDDTDNVTGVANLTYTGNLTTSLTEDSIPFIGVSGVLSEDNTDFTFDGTDLTVGGNILMTGTGALDLAVGTDAQRPTASQGMVRYNTDQETFEGYNGSRWGDVSIKDDSELVEDGAFNFSADSVTCLSATKTYNSDGGVGKSSGEVQIDFTADGQECTIATSVSDATKDNDDQLYVASIYLKTSDATVGLEWADSTTTKETAEVVNSGDYIPYSYQIIPGSSLVTKITGDTGDTAYIDLVSHKLGGLPRAPSKNCSSDLDCENVLSGFYDASEATVNDSIKNQVPENFTTAVAKSGTSDTTKTITVESGIFSETPICVPGSVGASESSAVFQESISSATSLVFTTRNTDATFVDGDFSFSCTKAPADYKPLQEKGVVLTGSSAGAFNVASNRGGSSNVPIGTDTVIPLGVDEDSKNITWDTANDSGEILKSGYYLMLGAFGFLTSDSDSTVTVNMQVDSGSGFSNISNDASDCNFQLLSGTSSREEKLCPFLTFLSKGDKFRFIANSNTASSSIQNLGGRYPRLVTVPVLDREQIAADLMDKITSGDEKQIGFYDDKPMYRYCNEVSSDVTSSNSSFDTSLPSGLEPVGYIQYASNAWLIDYHGDSTDLTRVFYDSSNGNIGVGVKGTGILGAGTRYCLKYTKP